MKNIVNIKRDITLERINFKAFSFEKQETQSFVAISCERFIVLFKGKIDIYIQDDQNYEFPLRRSVFTDPAAGLFIPADYSFVIKTFTDSEIGIYESLNVPLNTLKPFMVSAEDLKEKIVGEGNYQRRVVDLLTKDMPADHLIVGETFSEPAQWSSYPPHKHDKDNHPAETEMEEIYYFKVENQRSFAFQAVYSYDHQEEYAQRIYDNDVMIIKRGFHPVAAPPDAALYYLWGLSGVKRDLCWFQEKGYE